MELKRLDFAETLKDSIAIGVKNAPSVVVAVALWLVTIWIPYINIGTTIAISLLPVELAKGKNPMQAIKASNDATYGSKWTMFLVLLVFAIIVGIVFGIFLGICSAIDVGFITFVVMFVLIVLMSSVRMAIDASFWKQLKDNVE